MSERNLVKLHSPRLGRSHRGWMCGLPRRMKREALVFSRVKQGETSTDPDGGVFFYTVNE